MKKGVMIPVIVVSVVVTAIAAYTVCVLLEIRNFNPNPTVSPMQQLQSPETQPVDVVYTWVDSNDKQWSSQRDMHTQRRIRAQLETSSTRWPVLTGNLSELVISLKTVHAFLPWVRKIWVVTHRPQTISHPGLNFVHHDEILDPRNLPTFNSMAIETGLHRIPGLAEHFIYFNDDTFIGQPLTPRDFFVEGKPVMRQERRLHNWAKNKWFYKRYANKESGGPVTANMRALMDGNVYGTNHQVAPMTRSLMQATHDAYPTAWADTQACKFRDSSNVPPIAMSYNHGLRTEGVHVLAKDPVKGLQAYMRDFGRVKREKPALFCMHDVTTDEQLSDLNAFVESLVGSH